MSKSLGAAGMPFFPSLFSGVGWGATAAGGREAGVGGTSLATVFGFDLGTNLDSTNTLFPSLVAGSGFTYSQERIETEHQELDGLIMVDAEHLKTWSLLIPQDVGGADSPDPSLWLKNLRLEDFWYLALY